MKITSIVIIVVAVFLIVFQACISTKPEKEAVVKQKCREYLKNKYNKDFEIKGFKQFFHDRHWRYETDIEAYPTDNKLLAFWMKYDAKKKGVKSDNYKKVFWENQIVEELKPIVERQYTVLDFKAKLSGNGSIVFVNSDLEFYPNYQKMINNIKLPVLHLSIHIIGMPESDERSLDCFIELCEVLSETAFVKNEFEIYFYDKTIEGIDWNRIIQQGKIPDTTYCNKQLLFKFTNKHKVPGKNDLRSLLTNFNEDSLYQHNKKLFEMANNALENKNSEEALKLYLQIVESVSEYRFAKYMPAEAAYSVESAYYAAKIFEETNDTVKAKELYQYIIRRMEYEEVRLNLSELYKNALRKVDVDKQN